MPGVRIVIFALLLNVLYDLEKKSSFQSSSSFSASATPAEKSHF